MELHVQAPEICKGGGSLVDTVLRTPKVRTYRVLLRFNCRQHGTYLAVVFTLERKGFMHSKCTVKSLQLVVYMLNERLREIYGEMFPCLGTR